jgi:hypothetical protein
MSSVAEKVRKLLRIASDAGASEHEIELCLARADRLIQEHHLSAADLAGDMSELHEASWNGRFVKRTVHAARRCYIWEHRLAAFVQKYVGGLGYYTAANVERDDDGQRYLDGSGQPFRARTIVFFGLAEDIELGELLFVDLRHAIIGFAVTRHGGSFRGPGASYAQGFVSGLFTQMCERRSAERSSEDAAAGEAGDALSPHAIIERRDQLIQQKEDAALDWLASAAGGGIRLKMRRTRSSTSSRAAYEQGKADGERHEVARHRSPRLGHRASD